MLLRNPAIIASMSAWTRDDLHRASAALRVVRAGRSSAPVHAPRLKAAQAVLAQLKSTARVRMEVERAKEKRLRQEALAGRSNSRPGSRR